MATYQVTAMRDFGHEGKDNVHFVFPAVHSLQGRVTAPINGGFYVDKSLVINEQMIIEITIKRRED